MDAVLNRLLPNSRTLLFVACSPQVLLTNPLWVASTDIKTRKGTTAGAPSLCVTR
jgi:hypothetical protein